MTENYALRAEKVKLTFEGRTVLEDFSMGVAPKEKVLLEGPSGCGKSTIMKCFLGLSCPEAGAIFVNGQMLDHHCVWTLRRQVAYVGQEPDLGGGTVAEALERPLSYKANAHLAGGSELVSELLERFRIPAALREKNVSTLSGGEKQRIALVGALQLERPILLLDEPTSALDKAAKKAVLDYLSSRDDLTIVVVAHDGDVTAFADRTIQVQHSL